MAYEDTLKSISLNADASVGIYTGVPGQPGSASPNGGKQYHFLKLTGAHQVGLAGASDGKVVVGVLQNKPQTTGAAATVAISGVSLVVASAAISAGAAVTVNASSQAVTAGGTDVILGHAIEAATGAGQLIPVLLV